MNTVVLIGRLTDDPKIRTTQTGMKVADFRIAVDRQSKDQQADFLNCVAFGKTADFVGAYLTKGRKIGLIGRIQTGSYTNKDGQKVYHTDIVAERVEFCDAKPGDAKPKDAPQDDGFMSIPDDVDDGGLPFN